ncbi:MAG: metallophosphoesterase, partial [Bacteroidales bacterium]
AGLENCGHPPYGCFADWNKALQGISVDDYTILLVHDPWNWAQVVGRYPQIKLTLSGHTHAYQVGIDSGRLRWSPFFPKNPWCGLYVRKDQFLYISHGVGSAVFSARLGVWPEITLITIR